ncbi:MAG TPA: DMT family transporter [Casimicrobiaceae bacterium]|nr:DMT family transporter [Casimicrobiaceae bacterium]
MPSLRHLLALHAAVALFGLAGLFGAWLALPPVEIVLGRTAVAALALLGFALAMGDLRGPSSGLAANGLVLALHWVAFFAAVQVAGVAVGLVGYASFPLFTLALERATGERRAGERDWIVAALVVTGLTLTVPRFDLRDQAFRGLAWGVLSGATFAWLTVRNRRYARTFPARAIALWQNAFAALSLVPVLLLWPSALRWPTPPELGLLVILGLGCTALAHTLFVAALAGVTAHAASVVAALEPVYGIALAALLIGEEPTAPMLAGCALLVGAAVVASPRIDDPPAGPAGTIRP